MFYILTSLFVRLFVLLRLLNFSSFIKFRLVCIYGEIELTYLILSLQRIKKSTCLYKKVGLRVSLLCLLKSLQSNAKLMWHCGPVINILLVVQFEESYGSYDSYDSNEKSYDSFRFIKISSKHDIF